MLLLCALGVGRSSASETSLSDWLSALGEAAQDLADGRFEDSQAAAKRALDSRPQGKAAVRASAALGLALRARGLDAEAARALETALADKTAPAAAYLARARGEALLGAGDAAAAARVLSLAASSGHGPVARQAGFLEGRALIAAGLAQEAAAVLQDLLRRFPGDPGASAGRLDLAAALREAGEEGAAVTAYREVWLSASLPESEMAGERLEAWRRDGGPVPPTSAEDRLTRAERFLAGARPELALQELEPVGGESLSSGDRALLLRAEALAGVGHLAEAAQALGPLAHAPDPGIRRGAELVLARAAARAGRIDEAVARYRRVSASRADVPGLAASRQRDLGDESAYLAAWLRYDGGQYALAVKALESFARAQPGSRHAQDALWFAAWARVRLGNRREAARALERLSDGPRADAAAYWRGRLLGGADEIRLLGRASILGGDGWYGLLARARLLALGERAPRPRRPPSRPLPDLPDARSAPALATAADLLGLGLTDAALDELRELAGSPRARAASPHLAQLAAYAGDAELPFRMARDHLGPSRRVLRWSHPSPHFDLVEPAATAAGVDPSLVLAVMRKESNFRRGARSAAGAEGLLQLRPATAGRLAAILGMPDAAGRLGDPAVNLPLGIRYLGLLEARFGDPAVALAGYNAGPAPAAEWARARAGEPLDEWVESIPFRETRQYLKSVLADWDVYRELRGEPSAPLDPLRAVPLPAKGVEF